MYKENQRQQDVHESATPAANKKNGNETTTKKYDEEKITTITIARKITIQNEEEEGTSKPREHSTEGGVSQRVGEITDEPKERVRSKHPLQGKIFSSVSLSLRSWLSAIRWKKSSRR